MAQTAADVLGVPVERVEVEIGDSLLPPSGVSGGSQTAVSVTSAVMATAELLRKDIVNLAVANAASKLKGRAAAEIVARDGKLFVKGDSSKSEAYADILRRNNKDKMEACATAAPYAGDSIPAGTNSAPCAPLPSDPELDSNKKKYSFHSFGAQFAEVRVDEDTGMIRVTRFASVMDIGRVLNEKTARSQVIGGVVYGLGQALTEETVYDKRWANPVTRSFADYHVPVNLDVPAIDVYFIGKPDPHISSIGARGVGEIGITGVAAAVANAVFNATGKRLRELPLTPDKLI
jgi:xanthine dehydrogenase YagR molybdenum-binding subunit